MAEHGNRTELPAHKYRSQLLLLSRAGRQVLSGMFGSRQPADRELAAFYRQERKCGSRDRSFINGGLYALLRHWGWTRKLLNDDLRRRIESGNIALSDRDLLALFFFGAYCDHKNPEFTRQLANHLELSAVPLQSIPETAVLRGEAAAKALGFDMTFSNHDLLPDWCIGLLPQEYIEQIAQRPPVWLRINRFRKAETLAALDAAGIQYTLHPTLPFAAAIRESSINLPATEAFQKGWFEIQDLASQLIAAFCTPGSGERWFDPCAGAGGKTLALADAMQGKGTISAGDIREKPLIELRKRANRYGYSNIQIRQHSGKPPRGLHPFDGVLVDAPCSGSGVWKRNPGNQWLLDASQPEQFAEKQLRILEDFSACVKKGGTLVYATCSAFRIENQNVVERFLSKHPDFELSEIPHPLDNQKQSAFLEPVFDFPCDIMFAARMERKK